jgi:hypothetical protein
MADNLEHLQEILVAAGYDGLEVRNKGQHDDGVVTLSEIGTIWTINQQAKPLKTFA